MEIVRIILGLGAVVLPGVAWTFALARGLTLHERFFVAVVLSVVLAPGAAYLLNATVGMPLTLANLALLGLTIGLAALPTLVPPAWRRPFEEAPP